jgi:CRISPR-associated protein Csd1
MTVLAALSDYYDRLADRGDVPPYGYSMERISYGLVLSEDGQIVDIVDFRIDGKHARSFAVPQSSKRPGKTPKPFFLWDNTKQVFGVGLDKKTKEPVDFPVHHETFKTYHQTVLNSTDDPGLVALLRFLDAWTPERFQEVPFKPDMLEGNFVFMLENDERRFIHDRPAARLIWQNLVADSHGEEGTCLVTGRFGPIARLHPSIKGVRGAQSTGASIVSFNCDAFTSYGKDQGLNSPVSEVAASQYGAALNAMLARDSGHSVQIGDATTVFWCDARGVGELSAAAAEDTLMSMWSIPPPPSPDDTTEVVKVRETLIQVAQGRPLPEVRPDINPATKCFILGLAPNMSRLSIRFWHVDTFGHLADRIGRHWQDLYIEPYPWRTVPSIWSLLMEMLPSREGLKRDMKDVPPTLAGETMRSVLTGTRYPMTLLLGAIMRIRADGDVSGKRVSIIKACLQRNARLAGNREDIPVGLDKDDPNEAYRLGRLFAVLENVQRKALGKNLNATIRDKYFGSAAATPATIFPMLLKNSNNHLASLRKDKKASPWEEGEIGRILSAFSSGFPRILLLEDQGRFAIGYYHQRQDQFAGKNGNGKPEEGPEADEADNEIADQDNETEE